MALALDGVVVCLTTGIHHQDERVVRCSEGVRWNLQSSDQVEEGLRRRSRLSQSSLQGLRLVSEALL